MFELRTKRLRLIALDAGNLRLSLEDPRQMERNLGLGEGSEPLDDALRGAVQQMLDGVLQDKANYLWHTNWKIIWKEANCAVGGLCFKGPAGETGEVEIGYGMDREYQNRGYMTEALRRICRWALSQAGVSAIVAETEKPNLASQRVLEKAGFVRYRETEEFLCWRFPSKPYQTSL